jgi:PncC family amidohydrolase
MLKMDLKLSLAESCTGGMIAALLTSFPGASKWFAGGVTAYSDQLKQKLLGVPQRILEEHGAVSRETALAMARGIMQVSGTSLSLSVTGVAGPGGGTVDKPVGTVCMALCHRESCWTWLEHFQGDREAVRRSAVSFILEELLSHLRGMGP